MCTLLIAYRLHPDYPLIIAANRDEFHARPTAPSMFWKTHSDILAGQDLQGGGTWMGVSKAGRISALTNIREPHLMRDDAKSRGDLVINWLNAESDMDSDIANLDITNYAGALKLSANQYNGYNLLFGDVANLVSFNSRHNTLQALSAGVYGMSNATLDTPWPKVRTGKQLLQNYCERKEQSFDALFDLLSSRVQAPDNELPNTGVSLDWERRLSALFIVSEEYGTRSSTLLRVNNDQQINWVERTFNRAGDVTSQQQYQWHINDNSQLAKIRP